MRGAIILINNGVFMMNIKNLILVMGFSIISACASNEATMDIDESNAEAAKDESVAAMEESKTDVQEMKEEAPVEEVTEAPAEATETAAAVETAVTTSDTDNRTSTCEHGDQVRIITVVYDNDATDTVCEVNYEKSTGVQTLWTANSDRKYCMDKAAAFVQKQEGWGWTCSNLE